MWIRSGSVERRCTALDSDEEAKTFLRSCRHIRIG